MSYTADFTRLGLATGLALITSAGFAQSVPATAPAATAPYKIVNTAQFPGSGGLDYVFADSGDRRLYVARGPQVHVFDLDTLKETGTVAGSGHGAVVDPVSHHGFISSRAIVMFDSKTLEVLKTITVTGSPDGMLFEPLTERVYVLSHQAPNVTVIDGKDGSVVGTIDLGGAPEQGQSDGLGHVYIDVEDQANIAVVDAKTLTVTAHYDISSKGTTPAGLGLDIKNHILFAMCRNPGPGTCVILSADDGKILTSLPLAGGSDGGLFNPATMEAFSSHGNGTLTVIKENSPTSFEVEQTVVTKSMAKTCTLDTKKNQIVLITTEPMPAAATAAATSTPAAPATPAPAPAVAAATPAPAADAQGRGGPGGPGGRGGQRGGGGRGGPGLLDLIVVGR